MIAEKRLLELLDAAIDGIDGYESEHGDLRYWNSDKIGEARALIGEKHMTTLPCHIPGYFNPCPDCPLDSCLFETRGDENEN